MRKSTLILGTLLGISLLVNGMTLARLVQQRNGNPRAHSGGGVASSPAGSNNVTREPDAPVDSSDISAVYSELHRMRKDLAALKKAVSGRSGDPVAESDPAESEPSGDLASDPAVAKLIAEQEALKSLWKDLRTLNGLRKSLGDQKYRELVLKATTDYLNMSDADAAAFLSAAQIMMTELDEAQKQWAAASKTMQYDRSNPDAYRQQYQQLWGQYQDARKNAKSRVDPYLNDSTRHKQFKQQLDTWVHYASPNSGRVPNSNGGW